MSTLRSAAAELCLDSKLLKRLDGEPQEFDVSWHFL